MNMRKMWPVLAALVVLTSACRLETNVSIDVNEDGSGSFTAEIGLDQEMRDALEGFGGSDDLLSGLELGDGTPTETRTEGDMTYISATQSFADTTELKTVLDSNQDQASFEEFELEVTEDGARLVARTGPLAGEDGTGADELPFDISALSDDFFSANIFVKLPGEVKKQNADEIMADGRLRWAISVTDPIDIEAETSLGSSGVPWLPIGIAAVVVLGVGAYAVTRRKDDPAKTALESTAVPPAPMGFGDAAAEAGGTAQSELPPELPPQ
jgi:hypothetical protein